MSSNKTVSSIEILKYDSNIGEDECDNENVNNNKTDARKFENQHIIYMKVR